MIVQGHGGDTPPAPTHQPADHKPDHRKPAGHKQTPHKPTPHKPTAHKPAHKSRPTKPAAKGKRTAGRGEVELIWFGEIEYAPLAKAGHLH